MLELTSDSITAALGNIGYAFAEVNPIPEIDREKRTVGINFCRSSPARASTCAASLFKGNTRTADEVLRREMRQFEGTWYSQAAIDRSKVRLQRLGYFETVDVETPRWPAATTRSTWSSTVKETTSGSFAFGLGYSQLSGLITIAAAVAEQLPRHRQPRSASRCSATPTPSATRFSYLNPYFTDDGCRSATT